MTDCCLPGPLFQGFSPSSSRMNSKKRSSVRWTVSEYFFALPQCFSRLPAVDNEAQGGDPSMRLNSPAFKPTASRMSLACTSRMSRVSRIVSRWLARYTSAAAGMNSLAHATRKPAIRYPRHDPPQPLKVEMTVKLFHGTAAISAMLGTR